MDYRPPIDTSIIDVQRVRIVRDHHFWMESGDYAADTQKNLRIQPLSDEKKYPEDPFIAGLYREY